MVLHFENVGSIVEVQLIGYRLLGILVAEVETSHLELALQHFGNHEHIRVVVQRQFLPLRNDQRTDRKHLVSLLVDRPESLPLLLKKLVNVDPIYV